MFDSTNLLQVLIGKPDTGTRFGEVHERLFMFSKFPQFNDFAFPERAPDTRIWDVLDGHSEL